MPSLNAEACGCCCSPPQASKIRTISPAGRDSMGVFIGTGDQDNYLKLVVGARDGGSVQCWAEVGGTPTLVAEGDQIEVVNFVGGGQMNLEFGIWNLECGQLTRRESRKRG